MVFLEFIPSASLVYYSRRLARLWLYYSLNAPFPLFNEPVDPSACPFLLLPPECGCFLMRLNSLLLFDSRLRWRVAAPAILSLDDSEACCDPNMVETPPGP